MLSSLNFYIEIAHSENVLFPVCNDHFKKFAVDDMSSVINFDYHCTSKFNTFITLLHRFSNHSVFTSQRVRVVSPKDGSPKNGSPKFFRSNCVSPKKHSLG